MNILYGLGGECVNVSKYWDKDKKNNEQDSFIKQKHKY